ncbi:aldose epimerase family protein [Cetobacterium sp. SF1]|uniref:aldose epimerase family protein n=1 Tax=Cetobacterium sp. SF1 TaxID=3417654 RepID=UPI003CE726D3
MISVKKENWNSYEKKPVILYKITNNYLDIEIINYGAIIKKLCTPDKNNIFENIILGYDSFEEYLKNPAYFGSIIGRNAGRIKNGSLNINNTSFQLTKNNGSHQLHGGFNGLHNRIWDSSYEIIEDKAILTFTTTSSHLEEGYPGNLKIIVKYIIQNNKLTIEYNGYTDQLTYLNLTNHTYFNLSGNYKENILNHEISLKTEGFFKVNSETLPTEFSFPYGPFDLNNKKIFRDILLDNDEQIKIVNQGLDHPFILKNNTNISGIIYEPKSGRKLELITDQKSVVIYSGNYLDEIKNISNNIKGQKYLGFCLETQDIPDITNINYSNISFTTNKNPYYQRTTFIFSN